MEEERVPLRAGAGRGAQVLAGDESCCHGQELGRHPYSLQNTSRPCKQEGHLSSRMTGSMDTGRLLGGGGGDTQQLNHILKEPAGHPWHGDWHEGHHEWKLATQPGQQSPFKDKEPFLPSFSKKEETFLRSSPANCPSQLTGQTWLTLPSSSQWKGERGFLLWFIAFKLHSLVVTRLSSLEVDIGTDQGSLRGRKGGWIPDRVSTVSRSQVPSHRQLPTEQQWATEKWARWSPASQNI